MTLTLASSQSSLSRGYLSLCNNTQPQILSLSGTLIPVPPFRSLLNPSKRSFSFFISSFVELKHDNLKQWRLVENPTDPESLWLCYGLNHLLLPRQALVRWVPAAPLLHHNASSPFHRLPLTQSKQAFQSLLPHPPSPSPTAIASSSISASSAAARCDPEIRNRRREWHHV